LLNLLSRTLFSPVIVVLGSLLTGCAGDETKIGTPITINVGLSYTNHVFYEDEPGAEGDIIEFDLLQKHGDQILVNTYEIPSYRIRAKLAEPLFESDYMQVLRKLSPGDSVSVDVVVNSLPEEQIPPQLRNTEGSMTFTISVRNLWNEASVIQTMVDNLSEGKSEPFIKTSRGVQIYWDERVKDGAKAEFGDSIFIHVAGKFLSGQEFMSTFDSEPISFVLGEGLVEPKAWEDACSLVSQGDKITIISPHDMAYGTVDRNPILRYSTLVFEIDIVKVKKLYE